MGEVHALLCPAYYTGGLEVSLFGPQLRDVTTSRRALDGAPEGITVEKFSHLYHDWILQHGGDKAPKPDLVVAFNSGVHTGRWVEWMN